VQLPGTSSELLQKFREKRVDFAAHSNAEDGGAVFLNLLGKYVPPLRILACCCMFSQFLDTISNYGTADASSLELHGLEQSWLRMHMQISSLKREVAKSHA
jgi:hypothetical protein